jgi:signal transduction histidine kinase
MAQPGRRAMIGHVNGLSMMRARGWLARALTLARSAEPGTGMSRRALAADIALVVAATAVSLAAARVADITAKGPGWIPWHGLAGFSVQAGLSAVLAAVPLVARRRFPLATFWVILIMIVVVWQFLTEFTFFVVMFAAYCAVAHSRFRGPAILSMLGAAIIVTAAYPQPGPSLPVRFTALAALLPITVVGSAVHTWRHRARDSQARLVRERAEHEAATRRALELERVRIARELHDVVTHNVSVTVVLAGAARRVLGGSPDEARAALLAVEASGRAAMTEMRHLLGLLAPSGGPETAIPAGDQDPWLLRPQPGLGRLQPLIDQVAAAGLPVELHVTGSPQALPPGLDLAAYRVIQEALTNVMKHAGLAQTTVSLDYRPGGLLIDVADDGPPVPAAAPPGTGAMPGTGRGLLGLRERVALYGGEFTAARRPGGGWRTRARIPVDPLLAGQTGLEPLGPPKPAGRPGSPGRADEASLVPVAAQRR